MLDSIFFIQITGIRSGPCVSVYASYVHSPLEALVSVYTKWFTRSFIVMNFFNLRNRSWWLLTAFLLRSHTFTHIFLHFFYIPSIRISHIYVGLKHPFSLIENQSSCGIWLSRVSSANIIGMCLPFVMPFFPLSVQTHCVFLRSINKFFPLLRKKKISKSKSIALNGIYILHICVFIHYCSISSFRKNCSVCETRT